MVLLVTGITGHTGKFFLRQLVENNYNGKIRCLVRNNSNTKGLEESGLNIELVIGDLNDASCISRIMKGVNTVLHIYHIRHSIEIVKSAIANAVERVILVHTTGVYSKYKRASAGYKRIESEVLKITEGNISMTVVRPTMIYGNMRDGNMSVFIRLIDKMMIFPLIDGGKALIQPVNGRDLGKAYYDVLIRPRQTANKEYNLSGEKAMSIREILDVIRKYLNTNTIFVPIPMSISILISYFLKIITFGKCDIVEKVLRMGEDRAFDHNLATEDFNYSPMSFEKGIEIEIDEYTKQFKS